MKANAFVRASRELFLVGSKGKLAFLFRRAWKFSRELGFPRGVLILAASMLGREDVSVSVPDIRYPLTMRPRTSDRFVFEQIFLDHEYDLPSNFLPQFIIDAGANVGYASIYFANRYPDAAILAIEPDATNFQRLAENTSTYPNIVPLQAALWSSSESLVVNNDCESWACRVEQANGSDRDIVPGITIAELLKRCRWSGIDILKMDIEGAEREVFASNYDSWLGLTRILLIELHDRIRPGCSSAVLQAAGESRFHRANRGEYTLFVNRSLCPDLIQQV